jgi:hypothetical protein
MQMQCGFNALKKSPMMFSAQFQMAVLAELGSYRDKQNSKSFGIPISSKTVATVNRCHISQRAGLAPDPV